MSAINILSKSLNAHLHWNKARIYCFSSMLISLLQKRTVNLTSLALGIRSETDISSRYRRLQRFFSEVEIDYGVVAGLILSMFFGDDDRFYLTMDRTNWKWGKTNINILMLGVVYKGQAIPVLWLILNKRGNSNMRERIAFIKRFIRLFGKERIKGILADREFIGSIWFNWLKEEKIPFVIRVKENFLWKNSKGKKVSIKNTFQSLKAGKVLHLGERNMTESLVHLSGQRLETGELLIVAYTGLSDMQKCIDIYGLRWEIETLFGCLKGRGFNFEDTRVIKRRRIKKMITLLAIAFCWAHKTGEWRNENVKSIRKKTHGRLAQSIFRYGLDWLDEMVSISKGGNPARLIKLIHDAFVIHQEKSIFSRC